jgi:hypothetical protein
MATGRAAKKLLGPGSKKCRTAPAADDRPSGTTNKQQIIGRGRLEARRKYT